MTTSPHMLETRVASEPEASSGPAGFAQLDSHAQKQAFDGLSRAAMVYSAVYTAAWGSGLIIHYTTNIHDGAEPSLGSYVISVFAIVSSALIALFARRHAIPVRYYCSVGIGFAVLASLGIVASEWDWGEMIVRTEGMVGVHWIGIWILVFPLLTLTPGQVVKAGVMSALTLPIMIGLGLWRDGIPIVNGEPATAKVVEFLVASEIPIVICIAISAYMASRLFGLTKDVSKARLLGNYQLGELIGAGGMGEVWHATHRLLARPAAIKIIRSDKVKAGSSSPSVQTSLRRFEREAQATAQLTSPHTVELFDFGINNDGTFYYVMELLEGMDLRTLVDETGRLPQERCVHLLRQACASLGDAHGHGLVHRDVKPANLFVCRRGLEFDFIKVLDFGLVKDAADKGNATQLTIEGVASGTPAFMAPEMAMGSHDLDGRVDLYALGCVAYWLLTGQLVFEATSVVAMAIQHAKEPPVAMSQRVGEPIDAELEALVLSCLAKDRDDRPASAVILDSQLAGIEQRLGPWTQERAERWWRSHLPHLTHLSAASFTPTAAESLG